MSAFRPISPCAAVQLLEDAHVGVNAAQLLTDLAAAGLVKGYARLIETETMSEPAVLVRDSRIGRTIWKQVVAEEAAEQVFQTGSVRLAGGATSVIGIRFDENSVRAAAGLHGEAVPDLPISEAPAASNKQEPVPQSAATALAPEAPVSEAAPRAKTTLDADRVSLSIAEAASVLGLSRGTIYKLLDEGRLGSVKVGGRRLVSAESVRALLR